MRRSEASWAATWGATVMVCVGAICGQVRGQATADLPAMIERFAVDRAALGRRYRVAMSPARSERFTGFYAEYQKALEGMDLGGLGPDDRLDYLLFENHLRGLRARLAFGAQRDAEIYGMIPFWRVIVDLAEARWRVDPIDPAEIAARLSKLADEVDTLKGRVLANETSTARPSRSTANRAVRRIGSLQRTLDEWFRFYDGYDPTFSWWVREPHRRLARLLTDYAKALRETYVGTDPDALVGDPIGREALLAALAQEFVPYSPEELVEIAEREFRWCDAEMATAATALGFDDWRKAQDHVKGLHVAAGGQAQLIKQLATEAVRFLDERELVTVPPLCREIWRMEMMSPERQKVSPYFLGGETILVSFPTDTMGHADKLMSMRGNNIHFSRATVQHELIPGHHLQGFMMARHRPYRRMFSTPFWIEGWALYWEMLLYDLGFPKTPEDRVGMLFWRKHRCARIIFSLNYHLGRMTAEQCVDYLVERVGHERNNATAEVRRSIAGDYGPLYQAAYMLGGLQIRALRRELVDGAKWTDRAFHDAILRENSIPVELLRARLTGRTLEPGHKASWRFYEAGRSKEGGPKKDD